MFKLKTKSSHLLYTQTLVAVLFVGCADSKKININGKDVIVEPYGWMNETEMKNDSVIYKVNTGNVVWSVIGVETVIVPIILTGNSLYEPVRKKQLLTDGVYGRLRQFKTKPPKYY